MLDLVKEMRKCTVRAVRLYPVGIQECVPLCALDGFADSVDVHMETCVTWCGMFRLRPHIHLQRTIQSQRLYLSKGLEKMLTQLVAAPPFVFSAEFALRVMHGAASDPIVEMWAQPLLSASRVRIQWP